MIIGKDFCSNYYSFKRAILKCQYKKYKIVYHYGEKRNEAGE
jgi:hypothetical protein